MEGAEEAEGLGGLASNVHCLSTQATEHSIYIWDLHGHLAQMLHGPKDGAVHFACHPFRPILACCARSGVVYVWTKQYSENWSAFAPDFKELEENEARPPGNPALLTCHQPTPSRPRTLVFL